MKGAETHGGITFPFGPMSKTTYADESCLRQGKTSREPWTMRTAVLDSPRTGGMHSGIPCLGSSLSASAVFSEVHDPCSNKTGLALEHQQNGYHLAGFLDPPFTTGSASSLVLDTVRGELVNASKLTPKEMLDAKALAASKNHSEAERRRRERINSHLATLRTIIPSSSKTDKASLLGEVISQVRDLKRQVLDIYNCGTMPSEHDELHVERDPASTNGTVHIRAEVCCNDRPGLMTDLKQALHTLGLRVLKAEISTLGGRIKNVLKVTSREDVKEQDGEVSVQCVQEALALVMEKPAGSEMSPRSYSKRRRHYS